MATAGAFSDYVEDKIAKWIFFNTAPTAFPTLYLAAFTVVPTDANGGTEVVTTGGTLYARVALSCGTAGTGAGSVFTETAPTTTVTNTSDILFPVAGASWGTVVGYALYDAASAGNMIARSDQTSVGGAISVAIVLNDQLKIPAGSLSITID